MTEHQPPPHPDEHGATVPRDRGATNPSGSGSGGPNSPAASGPGFSGPHSQGQYGPPGAGQNFPRYAGPGPNGPGTSGPGPNGPYHPNPAYGAQPMYPQGPMPPQGMDQQGWGPPQPGLGGPPPPRKGLGNWVWAVLALAVAIVLGTIVFALGTLSRSGDALNPLPSFPVAVPATTPVESATRSATEPPEDVLPPVNPHASEGLFLSPAYAEGGKSVTLTGEKYLEMVGASTDASIVAVNSDYELRGIDAASSEVVWTYPSYSCSRGTWDGVALCADTDDPNTASTGEPVPDIVGVDLATGKAIFRFAPESMPGQMDFIGADDAHGYFRVSLLGMAGYEAFGKAHVLALDKDGSVEWITPLEAEEFVLGAALVSDNQISINLEESVVVLDRASGAITADVETGDDLVGLCWDGWSAYVFDERRTMIYDLKGALVDEYMSTNNFIPDPQSVDALSVPAYELGAIDGGERFDPTWGVTRDGKRAVADDAFGVIAPNQEYLVEGPRLAGISGDGGLFLSDLGLGTVHDSSDGTALASFPPLGDDVDPLLVELAIVDGIVIQNFSLFENDRVTVMLPG